MPDTVLRIIPGKFKNKPVRISVDDPLYAESVAPDTFNARTDDAPDDAPVPSTLAEMTKAELVAHGEMLGLSLDASNRKADLIAAIEAHGGATADADAEF